MKNYAGPEKAIVVGRECDHELRDTLIDVLREMGAFKKSSDWALGGSQEIVTVVFEVMGKQLVVESETYEGLSIRGEASLVNDVQLRLQFKQAAQSPGPPGPISNFPKPKVP